MLEKAGAPQGPALTSRPCQQVGEGTPVSRQGCPWNITINTLAHYGPWIESLILKNYLLFLWNSNLNGLPVFLFAKSDIPTLISARKIGGGLHLFCRTKLLCSSHSQGGANTRTISEGPRRTFLEPSQSRYCCSTLLRKTVSAKETIGILLSSHFWWSYHLLSKEVRFFKKILFIYFERGEGKEKGRMRNINVWLPLECSLLGTWPATQACALTGNQTLANRNTSLSNNNTWVKCEN